MFPLGLVLVRQRPLRHSSVHKACCHTAFWGGLVLLGVVSAGFWSSARPLDGFVTFVKLFDLSISIAVFGNGILSLLQR